MSKSLNDVYNIFKDYLIANNIHFAYQANNCKRQGAYIEKKQNGILYKYIKISNKDNNAGQIYTLIHELTHYYNKHIHDKTLTYAQKEVVADQVGKYFIVKWDLIKELKNSDIYINHSLATYSQDWLTNRQFSDHKSIIINQQIEKTIDFFNHLEAEYE